MTCFGPKLRLALGRGRLSCGVLPSTPSIPRSCRISERKANIERRRGTEERFNQLEQSHLIPGSNPGRRAEGQFGIRPKNQQLRQCQEHALACFDSGCRLVRCDTNDRGAQSATTCHFAPTTPEHTGLEGGLGLPCI